LWPRTQHRKLLCASLFFFYQAFAYFGGVPKNIFYDKTKIVVAKILGDGARRRTQAFTELISHYLFQERFGRSGRGNDKGKVEGLVGYSWRN